MVDVDVDFTTEYDNNAISDIFANVIGSESRCRLATIRGYIEHDKQLQFGTDSSHLALVDCALFEGVVSSHESRLSQLITFGADVNACNMRGNTPLMETCLKKFLDKNFTLINFLLLHGANVNAHARSDGKTPLHFAVLSPNALSSHSLVDFLIQCQADPDLCDNEGKTPLHHAVERCRIEVVEKLLFHSTKSINRCDMSGRVPLSYACRAGNLAIVDLLLKYDADTTMVEVLFPKNGIPFIHIICRQGNTELLVRMLNKANLELKDALGLTPLLVLCGEYISIESVQHALSLGADIQARDNNGNSALDIAKLKSKTKLVELLLQHNLNFAGN